MNKIMFYPEKSSPYCACFVVSGRKFRRFFRRESEAKEYLRRTTDKIRELGTNALFFPQEERDEYAAAKEIATAAGYGTLVEAMNALLDRHEAGAIKLPRASGLPAPSLVEAYEEFLDSKKRLGRAEETLRDIRQRVGKFAREHENIPFERLTQRHVEEWCASGGTPITCRNRFSVLLTFLRFCKRKGYTALPLDFDKSTFLPRILKRQKNVFSLDETKNLLRFVSTSERYVVYLPFFAIQLFCGVRRTETERMTWSMIDLAAREIHLPAEITKTGDEHILRPPFIPETVFAWLAPFAELSPKPRRIVSPCAKVWARFSDDFSQWKTNAPRHTFATMHVSLRGDPAATALVLRHRNQQKLWSNYLARLVPAADAEAYFALRPDPGIRDFAQNAYDAFRSKGGKW